MDFRGDMERNRSKETGKRKCKQKQNKTTETQYLEINKRVERSIRKDKRNWINEQAKQVEEAERNRDKKTLYNITRKLSQRKFRMDRLVKTK